MVFVKYLSSVTTRRRFISLSLITVSISLSALFVMSVTNPKVNNSASGTKSVNERNLIQSILKCPGTEQIDPKNPGCVEKLELEAMENGMSTKKLMDTLISLYKSDGKKPAIKYRDYLIYCGSGFLHGMIESLQINEDPVVAGRELKPLCNKLVKIGIMSSDGIAMSCWHPLGHGLWYHFGDVSKALVVCSTAAPVGGARFWCAQAVLMSSDAIRELESVQKFSLSIEHCKVLALDDSDIYDGCVVTYARDMLQSTSKFRGEFVAFCATINPRVARGCVNTAAETVASKALFSDSQGVIEEVMLSCSSIANSEELCVTIAVSIASGTLGLSQSLLHERFDPAIEKFVPPERRNFVQGLIAHPERLDINV